MAEAGIGSREGKGPAVREGPAECHSMSLQMGYTPGTEFPRKCVRWHLPASHLTRNSRESVPGVSSRRPPATESPRKCVRWHLPASYLPRNPCESVPGVSSRRPPATESPRKCVRWHLPASYLPRNPCESVPGVSSRRPPATESPQKRSRCPFLPPTCHGFPANAFQAGDFVR